ELLDGPIKLLKKHVAHLEDKIVTTWDRRFFHAAKPTQDPKGAQTCFLMLRVKREAKELILKTVIPGIYFSPKTEDGLPDPAYKVVWLSDCPLDDLIIKANSEPTAAGLVRNKGGYGIRVKNDDFIKAKQRWQPLWRPLPDTPYNLQITRYYDLQNMPLSSSKAEVQAFLNSVGWPSIAVRQSRPRTWIVGAAGPPANMVFLAAHGTILVSERVAKGNGKGKQGKGKNLTRHEATWLLAGHSSVPPEPKRLEVPTPVMHVDSDSAAAAIEDKLQKRMDQLHQEQIATTNMLKKDFRNLQQQDKVNEELRSGINELAGNMSSQLERHMAAITSAISTQRADLNADIKCSQISLKDELMAEASNPGPMQVCGLNVQSLNAMADDGRLLGSEADVVVCSETSATSYVQQKVQKIVYKNKRHVVFSKAVDRRVFSDNRHCVTKGQAQGTAILSKYPTRPALSPWPSHIWDTSRMTDCFVITEAGPVHIIAVYGYHQGFSDFQAKNEELLRQAIARANLIKSPAIIIGDINCAVPDLAVWDQMRNLGWRDAALTQQERDGKPLQMTYKDISRLDYIIYNGLAAPAFSGFFTSAQAETDHRTVNAIFDLGSVPTTSCVFPMPSDLRELGVQPHQLQHAYVPAGVRCKLEQALQSDDMDAIWATFCEAFEHTAAQLNQGEPNKKFFGRSKGAFRQCQNSAPTPRARLGEFQPSGDETNKVLRQRIRQIRRLETYTAQCLALQRRSGQEADPATDADCKSTWNAIVHSTGFAGPFASWWMWLSIFANSLSLTKFIGGMVSQVRASANPIQITKAAGAYWTQFWNGAMPDEMDDEIVIAIHCLPQLRTMDTEIGEPDLQWALPKLGVKKARGMDGFSNFELKNMPQMLRPYFIRILNRFTDGQWPKALTRARMSLLYRTDQVGQVETTRPITILASVFRLWGKIMARKIANHIGGALPATLYGSVPGRSTSDMISSVQTRLEQALISGQPLYGVSFDFSKAYNTLPRNVLQQLNQRLGLQKLWDPYSTFLAQLERHFTCGNHWGTGIRSCTGVPEGCPIAVFQMIILTWMFTAKALKDTASEMYSYVDDWIVLSDSPDQMQYVTKMIDELAGKCNLIVNIRKSTVFATTMKEARKLQASMQDSDLNIGMAKNFSGLGVDFQTALVPSVRARNDRWKRAKVVLDRLQYMPWSAVQKTAVVVRAVLPLVFHGCQNWMAGKEFMNDVRAKMNHSVWGKMRYHLHFLSPLMSGSVFEPAIYVGRCRFAAFMRAFSREEQLIKEVWKLATRSGAFYKNRTRGMVSIFQNQLHGLGWAFCEDGMCTTPRGWSFRIWEISSAQFNDLLMQSWEDNLLQHLHQKENLTDLPSLSVMSTVYPEHSDPLIQAFMRKVRLGGLFANNRKAHFLDEHDGACVHCGLKDSLEHRCYHCPGTEHVRARDIWYSLKDKPKSFLLGGLLPRLQLYDDYARRLDELDCQDIQPLPFSETVREIFTDGSARSPKCPFTRLCSWAVTLAETSSERNTVLASGTLVGKRQTVFRAELHAVIIAIMVANRVRVFCDNASVVRDVNRILSSGFAHSFWNAHPDRDLLLTVAKVVSGRSRNDIQVIWTKAHRQPSQAVNFFDLWTIHHNARADKAAGAVPIPQTLVQLRDELQHTLLLDLAERQQAAEFLRAIMDEFPIRDGVEV
ncbi:unnamed protein product, partial [Symbiodinium sp. CCMP2456]